MSSQDPRMVRPLVLKRLSDLRKAMRRAMPARNVSRWRGFLKHAITFAGRRQKEKRAFIRDVLQTCAPQHVLDIGCSTGLYSRLAAGAGADVIAIDTDRNALDRLTQSLQGSRLKILPLCVDLAEAAGGHETPDAASFLSRCEGRFDTVMMVADSHRRRMEVQIPSGYLPFQCSLLTTCNLIFEWAPPSVFRDPEALPGLEAMGVDITEDLLRESFAPYFEVFREVRMTDGRILFHMIKR